MSNAQALEIKHLRIGANRGTPRLYIDSTRLRDAGLDVGAAYKAEYDAQSRRVTLVLSKDGDRVVCRKKKGDSYSPLIDLQNTRLAMFGEQSRVVVTIAEGTVEITVHHHDARAIERIERLSDEITRGEVSSGELCIGTGVLADALHTGFADQGINLKTRFAVEIDPEYLEAAARNCRAISKDTLLIEGGIQEVDTRKVPKVSILVAGLPCTGASKAGRTKRHLATAEAHPDAGYLIFSALAIIEAAAPAICIIENVCDYMNTGSYEILKGVLTNWGYKVDATIVGRELGAFEARRRMCMVATTEGLQVDLAALLPVQPSPGTLGELLDPVAADADCWKEYAYLTAKEQRDIAKGSGFRQQILKEDATHCGTITRGYAKVRSSDPRVAHPTNPKLSRLLSPAEHARAKGIPQRFIEGLSFTAAHEVLGQSVLYPAFRAVGRLVANALSAVSTNVVRINTAAKPNLPLLRKAATADAPLNQLDLFAFA